MTSDKAALAAYFDEASSWDLDRARQSERRARTAAIVAGASVLCTLMSMLTVLLLMPLKRVEPYLVRVDSRTGIVDLVPVYEGTEAFDEVITRYLIGHYITVCERFSWSTAESDYEECAAFNGAQRNQQWSAAWATDNPESPLNVYNDGSTVRAQVQSVTFFSRATGLRDLAQVRYIKGVQRGNGAEEIITHWIATVQFAYVKPATDPVKRGWNPMGFRVLEFRSEREASDAKDSAAPAKTSVR